MYNVPINLYFKSVKDKVARYMFVAHIIITVLLSVVRHIRGSLVGKGQHQHNNHL